VLALQGEDDEYGTLKQIRDIENHVPSATAIALAECGHSPHRDQAQIVGSHTAAFIKGANGG